MLPTNEGRIERYDLRAPKGFAQTASVTFPRIAYSAAHVVADGVRFFGTVMQQQARSVDRTARNFLREESGWWVPTSLWSDHKRAVQTLRLDADRLQAKVKLVQQQINKRLSNG